MWAQPADVRAGARRRDTVTHDRQRRAHAGRSRPRSSCSSALLRAHLGPSGTDGVGAAVRRRRRRLGRRAAGGARAAARRRCSKRARSTSPLELARRRAAGARRRSSPSTPARSISSPARPPKDGCRISAASSMPAPSCIWRRSIRRRPKRCGRRSRPASCRRKTACGRPAAIGLPRGGDPIQLLPDYCFAHGLVRFGFLIEQPHTSATLRTRTLWSILSAARLPGRRRRLAADVSGAAGARLSRQRSVTTA